MVTGPFPSKKSQTQNSLMKHDRRLDATSRHLLYSSFFAIVSEQVILPFLNAGYIVISDRSWISLYARAAAHGLDDDWCRGTLGFAAPRSSYRATIHTSSLSTPETG
jgi:thymidylate kinase